MRGAKLRWAGVPATPLHLLTGAYEGRRNASAWIPSWISSIARGNKGSGGTVVTKKKREGEIGFQNEDEGGYGNDMQVYSSCAQHGVCVIGPRFQI